MCGYLVEKSKKTERSGEEKGPSTQVLVVRRENKSKREREKAWGRKRIEGKTEEDRWMDLFWIRMII